MKKLIALLLCVCLLLSAAACTNVPAAGKSTDASNQDGEQRLRIVATLQSQQINFWSNVQHTLERLAKEENVDLTIMDLNGDVTTFANVIDDIVAMKPDGVITCGLETSTLGIHVKTLQDAGIPVVTYNISPEGATCPRVVADQSEFGRVAGTAAAEYWKENHPDTTPVGGAVDLYSAPLRLFRRIIFRSTLRRNAWMKWLPPIARPSPSPEICQIVKLGLATLAPVATAAARPWIVWNPYVFT